MTFTVPVRRLQALLSVTMFAACATPVTNVAVQAAPLAERPAVVSALADTLAGRTADLELRRAGLLATFVPTAVPVRNVEAQLSALHAEMALLPAPEQSVVRARVSDVLRSRRASIVAQVAQLRATRTRDTPDIVKLTDEDVVLKERLARLESSAPN